MSEITRPASFTWALSGIKTAPSGGLFANGWVPSQIPDPENANWLQDNAAKWTAYLTILHPSAPISADGIPAPVPSEGPSMRFGFNQGPTLSCAEYSVANNRVTFQFADFLNSLPVTVGASNFDAASAVTAGASLRVANGGEIRIGNEASAVNGEYAGQFVASPYVAKGVELVAGLRHVVTGVNPRQRFIETGSFKPLSTEAQAGAAINRDEILCAGNLLKAKYSAFVSRTDSGALFINAANGVYNVTSAVAGGVNILVVNFRDFAEIDYVAVNLTARAAVGAPGFSPGCTYTYGAGVLTITLTMDDGSGTFKELGDATGTYSVFVDVEAY